MFFLNIKYNTAISLNSENGTNSNNINFKYINSKNSNFTFKNSDSYNFFLLFLVNKMCVYAPFDFFNHSFKISLTSKKSHY